MPATLMSSRRVEEVVGVVVASWVEEVAVVARRATSICCVDERSASSTSQSAGDKNLNFKFAICIQGKGVSGHGQPLPTRPRRASRQTSTERKSSASATPSTFARTLPISCATSFFCFAREPSCWAKLPATCPPNSRKTAPPAANGCVK